SVRAPDLHRQPHPRPRLRNPRRPQSLEQDQGRAGRAGESAGRRVRRYREPALNRARIVHATRGTNATDHAASDQPFRNAPTHNPAMRNLFATNPQLVETTARRNSTLQGAYFMLAARALGLDCGPLSGFDNAKVDELFFNAGRECQGCDQEFFPEGHVRSNFLCNVGYGDPSKLMPRLPRLDFSESCSLL